VNPTPAYSEQVRAIVHEVLAGVASELFLGRVDAVLADWSSGKIPASQACEKVQKMVSLFIDENKAKEIASRCAPIVMRATATQK
jgi:hypothetical protein